MRLRTVALAWVVVVIMLASGCYTGGYRGFGEPFIGQRVQFDDCIDLAVAQTTDARAPGVVIAYTFGNRCAHAAPIDLAAIRAVGRYADGVRPLHALDTNHELRALRLEAMHTASEEIAYGADDDSKPAAVCVEVGSVEPSAHAAPHWLCFGAWDLGDGAGLAGSGDASAPLDDAPRAATELHWPLPPEPEPEVVAMPDAAQDRIETVGAYLATRITDKRRLVKALHDYVARRVRYDTQAVGDDTHRAIDRPAQDAESVFARRSGVCEGYARLLTALGTAAGVEIRYIGGTATDDDPGVHEGGDHGHAWNAANLDGRWVLIDATWDRAADASVSTEYLFMPPGRFARTHVPDDPAWTLTAPPLTFDQFVRSPWARR